MILPVSIISIRILVEVIKMGNVHSALLALVRHLLSSAIECAADYAVDRTVVSLVHLRVAPCYAILHALPLRAWLSRLLSNRAYRVRLVCLPLVVYTSVRRDVLHRLRAYSDPRLVLLLQWDTLRIYTHSIAGIAATLHQAVVVLLLICT